LSSISSIYLQNYRFPCAVCTTPIFPHALAIRPPTLASVVLGGRDLRILAKIGSVLNNKELAHAFVRKDMFCILSFIKIDKKGKDRYVNARFALGRYHCSVRKIQ
jgi:hypothetical protein